MSIEAVSGREHHGARVVVYLTEEELAALDAYKLALFTRHGQKIDRGRIVRASMADVLALGKKELREQKEAVEHA